MTLPVVAIIGRPNVGKSTLFNRIIKKPIAIVDDEPGITRDRNAFEVLWNRRSFMLVDTGGYLVSSQDVMEQAVTEQSRFAIAEADVVLLLTDVKSGVTDLDAAIRDEIIRSGKPVVLAVNKIDRTPDEPDMYEFYNLGIGDPHPISGRTGRGSGDLLDAVIALLPAAPDGIGEEPDAVRVALIGRPNVGKSSLVNALAGENRVLVTDIPGTTRDSTDTRLDIGGRTVILVDTAGLKRVTRLKESIEYYSYLRTQTSLARCDVAVVVIDINEGLTSYEKNLIDDVEQAGKGLIIAANKWDLVEKDTMTMVNTERDMFDRMPDKAHYPVVFTTALTGRRVPKLMETALQVADSRKLRVQTSLLNDFFEHLPIPPGAGDFRIQYGTQTGIAPPSFVVFVSDKRRVQPNFGPYLATKIREAFGFTGTPVTVSIRGRTKKAPR